MGTPDGPMEVVSSRIVHRGAVVTVRVDDISLPDGRIVQREVVEHPGAVVVAALDDEQRVALVRQYRHPIGAYLVELPAGGLEAGEDPAACASRELREETGLVPGRLDYLGSFFSSPGFVREELHAFLARGLSRSPLPPDDDEDIELEMRPLAHLLAVPGEVADAKTLATLLLVEHFLAGESAARRGEEV